MLRPTTCLVLAAVACSRPTRYPPEAPPPVVVPTASATAEPAPAPPPARADAELGPCPGKPAPAAVKQARAAFAAGQNAFAEADYARAAQYWREAYRYDCTAHALLLNLSRAVELQGDRPAAARYLRAYLERNPGDPDRVQLERRIQMLEGR